jgi:DNA invertase Pin-like site-specific DNA recombinase
MTGKHEIRAALYARVSTSGQDTEMQLLELRLVAEQRGWKIVGEFVDAGISGAKDRRPALDRLMSDAHAGKFDLVACWRFDRFARSTRHLLEALETFRCLNIGFFSLRESVDTTTPAGKALFTMIAAVAELERDLIRERVKAGVDRARQKGKKLGRPTDVVIDLAAARRLIETGKSKKSVAAMLGVPRSSLIHALKQGDKILSKTA